jgi:hypothetical protein
LEGHLTFQVDLELLDALGASRGTEELRAELARQEVQHVRELAEWDAKIASRTEELVGSCGAVAGGGRWQAHRPSRSVSLLAPVACPTGCTGP